MIIIKYINVLKLASSGDAPRVVENSPSPLRTIPVGPARASGSICIRPFGICRTLPIAAVSLARLQVHVRLRLKFLEWHSV